MHCEEPADGYLGTEVTMHGMESLPLVLETGRLVHVNGSFDIGRITAIERDTDSPVGIAVECIDGVRWFTVLDIKDSRASADTRHKGMRDDLAKEVIDCGLIREATR